ncbi:50S ribosomal protein L44e [Nanoarchaeota archaeon]
MKIPKVIKRFCPKCKTHTAQKVSQVSTGAKRGTMKKGSINRANLRGTGVGHGNHGRWGSKPPVTRWKRKAKSTKRLSVKYTCKKCSKSTIIKRAIRTSRLKIE